MEAAQFFVGGASVIIVGYTHILYLNDVVCLIRKYEFSDLATSLLTQCVPSIETWFWSSAANTFASNHLLEEFSHSFMKNSQHL